MISRSSSVKFPKWSSIPGISSIFSSFNLSIFGLFGKLTGFICFLNSFLAISMASSNVNVLFNIGFLDDNQI